jgi:filamentous hemagglutinin
LDTADSWDEGGTYRVLMHTAGGALVAGMGGGSAAGGAAGAGISSALAGKLNLMANTLETGDGTGADPGLTVGNVAANLLAGGFGTAIGGNSGAFTGANADLYNRSNGNGEGKGSTGNPFNLGHDTVLSACPAGGTCNEAVLATAIQAQGANADTALALMNTGASYGGPAAVVAMLGPEALTAAVLASAADFGGSAYSYAAGLSKDKPSFTNSYIAGIVGGLTSPLLIADGAMATMGTAGKIGANAYNATVTGVGAYGTAGMTGGNPDIAAGFGAGATLTGNFVKVMFPGSVGNFLNNLIQGAAGPIQNAVMQGGGSR